MDIGSGIHIQVALARLFGTHVHWRSQHLAELRVDCPFRQFPVDGLGDAEIDDYGHRSAVVHRNDHVRRLFRHDWGLPRRKLCEEAERKLWMDALSLYSQTS